MFLKNESFIYRGLRVRVSFNGEFWEGEYDINGMTVLFISGNAKTREEIIQEVKNAIDESNAYNVLQVRCWKAAKSERKNLFSKKVKSQDQEGHQKERIHLRLVKPSNKC